MNVPAMPAEILLRQAKSKGYTDAEVAEIIRLMRTRKFLEYDQKQSLLIRNFESVVDIKEAVSEQIIKLEEQIRILSVQQDFEAKRYPLGQLRTDLEKATERDEVDIVKSEVRNNSGNLHAYANSRLGEVRNKFQKELNDLTELIQSGLPEWLEKAYEPGPFQELLEVQRRNLATAFQATLDDMSRLRDDFTKELNSRTGSVPELVIELSRALVDLTKKARKLQNSIEKLRRSAR